MCSMQLDLQFCCSLFWTSESENLLVRKTKILEYNDLKFPLKCFFFQSSNTLEKTTKLIFNHLLVSTDAEQTLEGSDYLGSDYLGS